MTAVLAIGTTRTATVAAGTTDVAMDFKEDHFKDSENWIDVRGFQTMIGLVTAIGGSSASFTVNAKATENATAIDIFTKADVAAADTYLIGSKPTPDSGSGPAADITGIAFLQVKCHPDATPETNTVELLFF